MAAMWRKAMLYLGLGPDDEYDDYEPGYDDPAPAQQPRSRAPAVGLRAASDEPSAIGAVRPDRRPARAASASRPSARWPPGPGPQVVRPITVTPNAKPNVVVPTSFNQAQEVADTSSATSR